MIDRNWKEAKYTLVSHQTHADKITAICMHSHMIASAALDRTLSLSMYDGNGLHAPFFSIETMAVVCCIDFDPVHRIIVAGSFAS
jgi:hypothetical protein